MKNSYKILLTGGHGATTAASVVAEIRSRKVNWKIYWVGAKYAIEGSNIPTLEYEILPKLGVLFLPITTGRLQRKFTRWTAISILKIPVGFIQAFYYLLKVRPDVTLSFGGYSAFPLVVGAKILGIPVIIHEQTAAAGRANILSAGFADKIALAREESRSYFPASKSVVIGNPVSQIMLSIKRKSEISQKPVILITGGSRGSQTINETIAGILTKFLSKYKAIHIVGALDWEKFKLLKEDLPEDLSASYGIFSQVDPGKMAALFEEADIVISRAGANTVSDILATGRPSIVVPLPISYLDEQRKNAEFLARFSLAKIILQKDLNGALLLEKVTEVIQNYRKIVKSAGTFENPDKFAAGKLVDLVGSFLK